jgi:hypothetical protein
VDVKQKLFNISIDLPEHMMERMMGGKDEMHKKSASALFSSSNISQ